MDLKQLAYFVRVAELGSFTKASQALDVAQPALSRQVRLLEVELRQNLLVRNGRGATPTEAGRLLLEHGRGILHQVERAREELGRVRGALAGRVAIGLPPSLARVLTVPLTRAFRLQLPEASLSISEGLSATMQEWLATGRLDIAVLYNARPAPEIEITPLRDEELLLVQKRPAGLAEEPPAPPMPLAEVARLPLVIPSRPNAIRMHVETEWPRSAAGPTWCWRLTACPPSWTSWPTALAPPCSHATPWTAPSGLRPTRRARCAIRRCARGCTWPPAPCGRPRSHSSTHRT
jgi:LysR family nitrogen assimilation transcriptional regulator